MWQQRRAFVSAAVCLLACAAAANAELKIERCDRQVNLKNQFVVTIDGISLVNNGKAPVPNFQWCMLEQHMPRLAYLSVSFEDQTAVPDWQTRLPKAVPGSPAGIVCVELPAAQGEGETLGASERTTMTVSAVYTKLQDPFPKTVTQKDPQRVTYKGNMYALSPHPIATQTGKYEFSAEILSHTKPPKGEKKARSVVYGPFSDVAPLTLAPVEFHYVNNAPFAVAKTLERTLNVVWNTIYVDERYVVTHGGAKHVGDWSRHDQTVDPGKFAQSAFRELPADAPLNAKHLYFRDAIGNVSTSAVRRNLQSTTAALLPRIPLYGGWSTDFEYGFEVPLRSFSGRAPDGRKELVYAFAPHVKGLVTDEQVVLPEGAYDISVEVPFEAELSYEPKYTYLNKEGRTVVVLRAGNVIDALAQPFAVRYRLRPLAWAREPALWGASLAAVLAALVLFGNADFSLVHKGSAAEARGRGQAGAVASRAVSLFAERSKALSSMETVFARSGMTAEDVLASKKHTDAVLASTSEKLRDAHRKLEALAGPGKATQLKALIEKDAQAAAASNNIFATRLQMLRSNQPPTKDPKLEGEQRDVISSRKDVATAAEALAASIS